MTADPQGLSAVFGDIIENGWASEDNPTRVGFFVREGRRLGHMNPGRYFEVTDGAGKFWELPVSRDHKITVRRSEGPQPPAVKVDEGVLGSDASLPRHEQAGSATPSMDDCINAEICGLARQAAQRVTGGNYTFVDTDIRALEMLAYTAVRAGLTDGLHPDVAVKAREACAAHPFATEDGSQTPVTSDGEGEADRTQSLPHSSDQGKIGWVLVPREPTKEMIDAFDAVAFPGGDVIEAARREIRDQLIRPRIENGYRAMISAAPDPSRGSPTDSQTSGGAG